MSSSSSHSDPPSIVSLLLSSSSFSEEDEPPRAVVDFRLANGLCFHCGTRIYSLNGKNIVECLTIPGVAREGRCLFCYPEDQESSVSRKIDYSSLDPTPRKEKPQTTKSPHPGTKTKLVGLARLPVRGGSPPKQPLPLTILDADMNPYKGLIQEGSREKGKGMFTFKYKTGPFTGKTTTYQGAFLNGKIHGHGTITDASGCIYVGNFEKGAAQGYGVCTWAQGWKYEGYWIKDQRSGRGKLVQLSRNGEEYEGDWKRDKWHGRGTLKFQGGGTYVGSFQNHKLYGQGRYEFADGSVYQGAFYNDSRQGRGRMVYMDGTVYKGEWKNNWKDGNGTLTYKNGSEFVGKFRADKKVGGVLKQKDGTMTRQRYINGALQQ